MSVEKPQAWSKEQVTDLELAEVAAFKEELSKKKEEGATKKEDTPTDGGNKKGKGKGKGKGKEPFEGEMKEVRKVGLSELWKYSTSFERLMVFGAIIASLGSGVLEPLVITVLGAMLKNFNSNSYFFNMTPPEISSMLKIAGVDLVDQFHPTLMKFVYFGIAMFFGSYAANALWTYTSEVLCRDIRQRYVKAILYQEIGWHDKAQEGSLTTRLVLDTQLIQDGMGEKMGACFQGLACFLTGFVVAFTHGWKLALVVMGSLPVLALIGGVGLVFIKKQTKIAQDTYALAGAVAEQALSGIRTVYAFSLQRRFEARYDEKLKRAEKADEKKGFAMGSLMGTMFCTFYCFYALAFWYGSKLVVRSEMNGADVLVVFMAMLLGAAALIMIPQNAMAVAQATSAAGRVFAVIDRVPEISSLSTSGLTKERLEGNIEFNNVSFHYPTRENVPILKNLSVTVRPGQKIAFVGPSGSGKSTSVALVQRLYDAVGGEVLIDGQNIKNYNLHWLREQIGVVGQEPVLFNMTIKENILMGAKRAITEEKLIEVCKMANCHNFVSALPDGYSTSVGEYGGMLSGGQKQRIAIARALVSDPSILLLDEATSALDTTSERVVQRALDVAAHNRTTITIAHRLSTIRHADCIFVIDKGELVEQGTHEALIAAGGVYCSLVEKQRIAREDESKEAKEAEIEEPEGAINIQQSPLKGSGAQVSIQMEKELALPDAHEMTRLADARRAEEKRLMKLRITAFPLKNNDLLLYQEVDSRDYTWEVVQRMRKDWFWLGVCVLAATLAGATSPVFSYLLAKEILAIINPDASKVSPGALEGANLYSFLFAMVGLANLIGFGFQWGLAEIVGARLTRKLRFEMFSSILRQEVGFFDQNGHSVGALTGRLAKDTADVMMMVSKAWAEIVQFVVTIAIGLGIAFSSAANVTGIIIALVPFSVFAQFYRRKVMMGFESETRKAYEEASESANEAIKAIRTVVTLARESWFVDRYSASLEQPHRLGVNKSFRDSIAVALTNSSSQFINALAFYAGLRLIQGGHVSFEGMFITLMVAMITTQGIGRAALFTVSLSKGKIGAAKTFELVERQSAIDPFKEGYEPQEFHPAFEFKNVGFTYPARPHQPIFTGEFNVVGRPNQTLALVGPSGCGKSTTIAMLERWYDCNAGQVEVSEHNVKEYQLCRGLRSHIALVGQEPVLFDMTIRENIAWGSDREDVSIEEIMEAATTANIHKFISSLPDGYNTRVGDKGSQLSGGQKQRIAIARALIRKPKILLLDEATSALDSDSEKIVQQAIDNASVGRTTVMIAHRLSTIQNADQIAVVSNGRIVELGKHFELLARNGLYANLVQQQDLDSKSQ